MQTLQVMYHGHCFDGVLSAAIFARFYRQHVTPSVTITFRGMAHQQGSPYAGDEAELFFAADNAILDFRYSPSERLTWWCDHHASAFLSDKDRTHFASRNGQQFCFDPGAPSCAGLLARWLARTHQFDFHAVESLATWADVIDSARFKSPEQAVQLEEPALRLMMWLESAPKESAVDEVIETLSRGSLEDAYRLPAIQEALEPLLLQHQKNIELVRRRMKVTHRVALIDCSSDEVESYNKFIPYFLCADLDYVVGLTVSPGRAKLSVGSNPWHRPSPLHDLAQLCAEYGGGGHPVVAGISLPPDAVNEARRIAEEIAERLRRPATA